MNAFQYTHAVVCHVPDSFTDAIGSSSAVDVDRARKQHTHYVQTLKDLGLKVLELPPKEDFPDCIYVEDTAVIVNGTALITQPGHPSRRQEAGLMKAVLEKEFSLTIVGIENPTATLDGGDCLFTGREFFVGISTRTNLAGVQAVAAAFPQYHCTPIEVHGALHLKSLMSMVGPDLLCVSQAKGAQDALIEIKSKGRFDYKILTMPEKHAANCLFINGVLVHRPAEEIPESTNIFNTLSCEQRVIPMSELSKPQADMTCCSLLFNQQSSKSRPFPKNGL